MMATSHAALPEVARHFGHLWRFGQYDFVPHLFPKGLKEIRIDHEGTEYRLRITKLNKLILYR